MWKSRVIIKSTYILLSAMKSTKSKEKHDYCFAKLNLEFSTTFYRSKLLDYHCIWRCSSMYFSWFEILISSIFVCELFWNSRITTTDSIFLSTSMSYSELSHRKQNGSFPHPKEFLCFCTRLAFQLRKHIFHTKLLLKARFLHEISNE